jgi:hypothetical protein
MTEREKALEAALRECRIDLMIAAGNADEAARTDSRWDGVGEKLRVRVREAYAALAIPATERTAWEAGEGPQPEPVKLTCTGCKHLSLEDWTFYGENDEIDRGTDARCEKAGRNIASYWRDNSPPPKWCPFLPPEDAP